MDEQLTISTPEQVAFQYEMAGIGSRFVAALLDHLILFVILLLLSIAAITVNISAIFAGAEGEAVSYLVLAVLTIILFLIIFGYFIVFETVWNGQTPGKRAGRLRVIRHDGQPIRAGEAIIRNLVRLIDFMPGFYGVGFVAMFVDKDARRLGDFAAGTIVVREGEQTRLRDVQVTRPAYNAPAAFAPYPASQSYNQPQPYPSPYYTASDPIKNLQFEIQNRPDPLPGISIREVTHEDYALMRELIARVSRGELPRERGQELAARIAYSVASRMGQNFAQWQANGWQPLVFLQSVLDAHDVRG